MQSFDFLNHLLLNPTSLTPLPLPPISSDAESLKTFIEQVFQLDFKFLLNPKNPTNFHRIYLLLIRISFKFAETLLISKEIDEELKHFTILLKEFFEKDISFKIIGFLSFYTLFHLFLKENWLGSGWLFVNADKKLSRERKEILKTPSKEMYDIDFHDLLSDLAITLPFPLKELNKYTLRYIKSEAFLIHKPKPIVLLEKLSSEGEYFPSQLKVINIFQISLSFYNKLYQSYPESTFVRSLWQARLAFIHNKLLDMTPLTSFKTVILNGYKEFFTKILNHEKTGILIDKPAIARIYIELAYVQMFYYKYKASEESIDWAQSLLSVQLEFTGKWGYRTKYQKFTSAILVLEAKKIEETKETKENLDKNEAIMKPHDKPEAKKTEETKENPDKNEVITNHIEDITIEENADIPDVSVILKKNPQNIELEEESILFEKPKLLPDEKPLHLEKNLNKPLEELNSDEQLLVLARMQFLLKSRAKDDMMKEQISAALDLFLTKSNNWLSYSQGLLMRSINEFPSYKRRERSILQVGTLCDQFNDKTPDLHTRVLSFYSLHYPNYLDLQKQSAELYMQNGSVLSSCEIFKRIDLLEECVECLAMAGLLGQAKEMAHALLKENRETPKLLCILGDLYQEESYYKRSWKLSNKRFARAQRSLGRLYFHKKNLEGAIKAFNKALKINGFNAGVWFTLGCLYLGEGKVSEGIRSFSACVQIDESNGEAWANLSTCFLKDNRKKEAMSCLEQAVKLNENSWRIWSNLMIVALELKKFSRFLESVNKLIELERKELIDNQVLSKITQIFKYQFELYKDKKVNRRYLNFYHSFVERTLKNCSEKVGEKSEVWDAMADYYVILDEMQGFLSISDEELNKDTIEPVSKVKFIEPVDMISKSEKFKEKHIDLLNKIFEARLKACQCLMYVGWETDKDLCERVRIQGKKLIEAYKVIPEPKDSYRIEMFIETVNTRLIKVLDLVKEDLLKI